MTAQVTIQSVLSERFAHHKTKNPGYSLRAFSGKLGLSPGAVSGILAGKRRISRTLALKLATKLALEPTEVQRILRSFDTAQETPEAIEYARIAADQFKLIADWWHFGILSLVKTKSFREDPAWIARRLRIPVAAADGALDRLIRLGFLVRSEGGKLVRAEAQFDTTDGVANVSLRQLHSQELELARKSLEQDSVAVRDFTSMTMAVDPAKIAEAKAVIREFQDRLSALMATEPRTEVYKLCVQLFPLSDLSEGDKQ